MRDQESITTVSPGPSVLGPWGDVGDVHRGNRRSMAPDVDQRGHDVGTGFSQALALRVRYRAQSWLAATGATGAAGLVIAWAIRASGGS